MTLSVFGLRYRGREGGGGDGVIPRPVDTTSWAQVPRDGSEDFRSSLLPEEISRLFWSLIKVHNSAAAF